MRILFFVALVAACLAATGCKLRSAKPKPIEVRIGPDGKAVPGKIKTSDGQEIEITLEK